MYPSGGISYQFPALFDYTKIVLFFRFIIRIFFFSHCMVFILAGSNSTFLIIKFGFCSTLFSFTSIGAILSIFEAYAMFLLDFNSVCLKWKTAERTLSLNFSMSLGRFFLQLLILGWTTFFPEKVIFVFLIVYKFVLMPSISKKAGWILLDIMSIYWYCLSYERAVLFTRLMSS